MMNKLIIGNWKLNGSTLLLDEFIKLVDAPDLVIALPNVFILYANDRKRRFKIAAQDCSIYDDFGPYTGEVSAKMLYEAGCQYVIVGHSERRTLLAETPQHILKKLKNVVKNNMIAVFCIDENYKKSVNKETKEFLENHKDRVVLAYEPLSAIGTGVTPPPFEISTKLETIKKEYFGIKSVYGGSVNSENAKSILSINEVDGVLIGGGSLKTEELNKIVKITLNQCMRSKA
ncbi:MAG: triose-phosphate isomerase [Holosporales bacterium]|jgi:triosephosphate isomerase|nr:triose-phosphate isomerase [Holosporales bacterium]